MPQGHTDAGHQFPHVEGFGQVIVGPGVKTRDLILFLTPRRDDDDGCRGPFPQTADDFQSVHVGQAQVQQNDIGIVGRGEGESFLAGNRLQRFESMVK